MRYKVIRAKHPEKMADMVNKHTRAGWVPIGGVCAAFDAIGEAVVMQAMTLNEGEGS